MSGHTPACLEVGQALYAAVIDRVVPVSSTRAAEMTKLLENIHRAVNIGLVNEMKLVADRMGIDIHEVIRAAATKPFGFTPYYPGPGLGGHCIPIDPFYLTWKAREYGLNTRFIELAGEVNTAMPRWVIGKTMDALNARGQALKDARVDYSDPYIPVFPRLRRYYFDLASVDPTPDKVAAYDALLLATDHSGFDYPMLQKCARLIVDTRGVYLDVFKNVIKA